LAKICLEIPQIVVLPEYANFYVTNYTPPQA